MIDAKSLTTTLTAVAALEPDIAIALSAYNMLRTVWTAMNHGKTEADYQSYLQSSSTANIDSTAALLTAQGFTETPPGSGNWAKPSK